MERTSKDRKLQKLLHQGIQLAAKPVFWVIHPFRILLQVRTYGNKGMYRAALCKFCNGIETTIAAQFAMPAQPNEEATYIITSTTHSQGTNQ